MRAGAGASSRPGAGPAVRAPDTGPAPAAAAWRTPSARGRAGGTAKARTSTESVTASGSSKPGSSSSAERARRSLAYRRSMPARPDSNRMAVLKRSVGRASFSSSCLRSHIGTK
ncbi:hypothetical protein GCM10020295_48450 [Streptomyces cinereospinus]